jgi:uncharacterized membrane protein
MKKSMKNGRKKKNSHNQINGASETTRIEAISDGTFAITITLLVLEIHRPAAAEGAMGQELLKSWPSYVAYGFAFIYVGVIWLNHHYVFVRLKETDLKLNWINFGVLGTAALIPLPTGVLADAFKSGNLEDQKAATALYALISGMMSLAWVPLYSYLGKKADLLKAGTTTDIFKAQVKKPLTGIVLYFVSGMLGWMVHPGIAVMIFIFMVSYYAWTSQGMKLRDGKIL